MRRVVVALALAVATAAARADDAPTPAPTSAPVATSHDGPGMYIGLSFRLGRTEDVYGQHTLQVLGLSTGARYRYHCLEAGLGLSLDWMQTSRTGHVLGGEAYVLRNVTTSWAVGGRVSAGRGEANDHEVTLGDGFVGMAGLRARYRDVLSVSFDGYIVRGQPDEHDEGLLVGVGATGDVFKYGYVTGTIGLLLAGGVFVLASHYGWFQDTR